MTVRSSSAADYLAAERTFLAWIRTGLALMGFGFVVSRFGLFLQALQVSQSNLSLRGNGISPWLGTALISLGIVVNILCAVGHVRLVRRLNRGGPEIGQASLLAISLSVALAALGLAMAIYLVSLRDPQPIHIGNAQETFMTSNLDNGIATISGHQSVDQTVQKLEGVLAAKGVKLFAKIDHGGEAEKAGLQMRPTKLLIFGNPKAGTPLMIAAPGIAIDLPLKVLVWEDPDGITKISYNTPAYLQARHALPAELVRNIAIVETLAKSLAE
jgi:uncharacterized protein (DUF302 family)/uncharacterized membrane protein YidH (DUF202 family)